MIPYYNERSALARSEAAIIMNHDDVRLAEAVVLNR
jgi:hypothetical protein